MSVELFTALMVFHFEKKISIVRGNNKIMKYFPAKVYPFVYWNPLRPEEKYTLFPVTSPKFLGSIGRPLFFNENFFV